MKAVYYILIGLLIVVFIEFGHNVVTKGEEYIKYNSWVIASIFVMVTLLTAIYKEIKDE